MFSELINFQNEGHECQCQCGSCKNNEQCQKSCSCPTGCNSDDKCPAVTSLKKPRNHAALGNKTNSL
ncbi:ACH_G0024110.mRNA.1.CDS.1 [Saccharomyces cerevisiae]|nr:ACH_G0024040.mRNA.1.CDS.1 [Saccharomyces cerevisiae]CAI4538337.1 ACH_G0024110.mRNA.1.CDS.1 [Saccharomyces cerevisiae]CAI6707709.1 ACH_G0024040.mRNA.1.CDS.1 [Saccharomyces cerevisiae]CAI6708402.1 ACH_G0024110.mRNA.1.CDS.1 [Saccharomyces cerevisiae]